MTITLTDEEFNLLMNLLDAHVENLREWCADDLEQDKVTVKERDDYTALFDKLQIQEMNEKGVDEQKVQEEKDYRDQSRDVNFNPYGNPDGV